MEKLEPMKDDMAQLLNCGNNHWVAKSTNLHGEPPTAQLIADLLQTKEDEITVSIVNVQMQVGAADCGL